MRRPRLHLLLLAAAKVAVGLYLLAGVAAGLLVAERFSQPPRRARTHPASWVSPRARDVTMATRDGLRLGATFLPPAPGRPVLVLAHGIGNSREDWLPWMRLLARVGYGALAFDWRAHGESQGERLGFGHHEGEDLRAVQRWLAEDPARDRPLGVVALSMGGGIVASHVDALGPRVHALVLDSAYQSLPRMVHHHTRWLGPLRPVARATISAYSRARGVPLDRVADLDPLRPRPLLVLHTEPDGVVPTAEGRALHAAYRGPKQAWISDAGGHVGARIKEWRRWLAEVAGFLADHVPGAPPAEEVLAAAPAEYSGLFQASWP